MWRVGPIKATAPVLKAGHPAPPQLKDTLTYRPSSQGWAPRVLLSCFSVLYVVSFVFYVYMYLSFFLFYILTFLWLGCYAHVFQCTLYMYMYMLRLLEMYIFLGCYVHVHVHKIYMFVAQSKKEENREERMKE